MERKGSEGHFETSTTHFAEDGDQVFAYVIRRIYIMIGTIAAISVIVFAVIEMPPGDASLN